MEQLKLKLKKVVVAVSVATVSTIAVAYPTSNQLQWPIAGKGVKDTSFFYGVDDSVSVGNLRTMCGKGFPTHLGVDITAPEGTPVKPIYPGKVVYIANGGNEWGNALVVSHDDNTWTSVYWHLNIKNFSEIQNAIKNGGYNVDKNTILGTVYNTEKVGDTNHLHLGIRKGPFYFSTRGDSTAGYHCSDTYKTVNPYSNIAAGNPQELTLPNSSHIVFDNTHSNFKYSGKGWGTSRTTDFYYGTDYHFLSPGNVGSKVEMEYTFSPTSAGVYDIYTRIPKDSNRAKGAKYVLKLTSLNKPIEVVVNQTVHSKDANVYLATINMKRGDKLSFELSNPDGKGYLVFDNLLFVRR